ncbi:MAG TPA: hypothetical protein VGE38_00095 [Nocardioides sp.]|uniref:hypothetical protein n=1 Tax=Nocardioides sp. TaxID=35761 RepID=UPI002EDAB546
MSTIPTLHSAAAEPGAAPTATARPGWWRRGLLVAVGGFACILPTSFAINMVRFLVTDTHHGHEFHQLTGQGLVLCALWLGALVPLLAAGWRGRRPSSAAGWLHVLLIAVGLALAVPAPGGGAPVLMGIIAVQGALVWLVLPQRPRLRLPVQVHPLAAPVALAAAAALTPYVIGQLELQNAATGHHASNPHYWDQAWIVTTLLLGGVLGAVLPAVRRLVVVAAAGLAYVGAAGVVLGEDLPWTVVALGSGVVLAATSAVRR